MGPGRYDFAGGSVLRLGELQVWKQRPRPAVTGRHCQRPIQELMRQNTASYIFLFTKVDWQLIFLIFFDVLFILLCGNSDVKGVESACYQCEDNSSIFLVYSY